jgi:hypothetical protein
LFSFYHHLLRVQEEPPKVKLISCLKASREPNDDKTILFGGIDNAKIDLASTSPIKQHIRQIDQSLKLRYRTTKIKNSKETSKNQLQRMNFMGIPISQKYATKKCSRSDIESIVAKISQTTLRSDEKLSLKERVVTTRDGVKFLPRIPEFETKLEGKDNKSKLMKEKFRFTKAQPHSLKINCTDKSLTWFRKDAIAKEENCEINVEGKNEEIENLKNSPPKSQSEMKKSFNEIIARKWHDYTPDDAQTFIEKDDVKSLESLSSDGTNFSRDSGSFFMILDKKIPKTQLNISRKFQVRSKLKFNFSFLISFI